MEDVAVSQFCGVEFAFLVEHSRPNGITPAQKQLDGERRMLEVQPFDEVDEGRITDAVVGHRLEFFHEELRCGIRPDHPPGQKAPFGGDRTESLLGPLPVLENVQGSVDRTMSAYREPDHLLAERRKIEVVRTFVDQSEE